MRFRHSESAPDAKSAVWATVSTMDSVGMGWVWTVVQHDHSCPRPTISSFVCRVVSCASGSDRPVIRTVVGVVGR